MSNLKTAFFCQNCGTQYPKWLGQCGSCKEWNTLVEEVIQNPKKNPLGLTKIQSSSKPAKINEIDTSSILISLKIKGETKDEILGATKIMRDKSLKIISSNNIVDTCGTGGDMSNTLNISTAASLVAASCGVTVAKHGNKSVSSKSGSADMLEKIGYKFSDDPKNWKNN